ncbi:hypothetical protein SOVF_179770 [Spinacia oleracea]|nr:hypothetical protein SOVF_179770 [Spinacia oleracea]
MLEARLESEHPKFNELQYTRRSEPEEPMTSASLSPFQVALKFYQRSIASNWRRNLVALLEHMYDFHWEV